MRQSHHALVGLTHCEVRTSTPPFYPQVITYLVRGDLKIRIKETTAASKQKQHEQMGGGARSWLAER